jgi:hypothetical protein
MGPHADFIAGRRGVIRKNGWRRRPWRLEQHPLIWNRFQRFNERIKLLYHRNI